MSSLAASTFLLRWKGVESGPFSIEEIRERLIAGEISRLHQVQIRGTWRLLDDLAELNPATEGDVQQQMESMRREFETRLAAERESRREPTFIEVVSTTAHERPIFDVSPTTRTSGIAVAAIIAGLCCVIPYVNWIAWIPALALGHIALAHIDRDSLLDGRWMAVVALVAGYFLVIMGGTYVALALYHGRRIF